MYILINYEKVFRYLGNEKAKNSTNLNENEIIALLQLMFELGIQYNKVSGYNLESYTKKFYNKFTYKKGLQLYFFLERIFFLEPSKPYRPTELNKIISDNVKNILSNSTIFGSITDEQLISIKKDGNLISPTEMTELLEIMVNDLKILENSKGIKNVKKVNYIPPGRRKDDKITKYEGFPSRYRLSKDFITKKNLFNKPDGIILLKNFITKNQLAKHYFTFNLNTIYNNASNIINKKITPQNKERLKNEIINKNIILQKDNFIQIFPLMFLFNSKEEIEILSNSFIDAILSSDDYTFLLFLIYLSYLLNKFNKTLIVR